MTATKRKPKKKGFVSIGGFWKTQVMTAEGWRTVSEGTITPKGKRVPA